MLCVTVLCAQELSNTGDESVWLRPRQAQQNTDHVDDGAVAQTRGVGAAAAAGCRDRGPTNNEVKVERRQQRAAGTEGRSGAQSERRQQVAAGAEDQQTIVQTEEEKKKEKRRRKKERQKKSKATKVH